MFAKIIKKYNRGAQWLCEWTVNWVEGGREGKGRCWAVRRMKKGNSEQKAEVGETDLKGNRNL